MTKPAVSLQLIPEPRPDADVVISVNLLGMTVGERLQLSFVETDGTGGNSRADRILATVSGRVAPEASGKYYRLAFFPDVSPSAAPKEGFKVAFCFPRPGSIDPGDTPPPEVTYVFALSGDRINFDEGDSWELEVRAREHRFFSPKIPIARIRRQLEGTPTTYDWHEGNDLRLYNDASKDSQGKEGAFADLLSAISRAKHFIFVADWSFQPLFRPVREGPAKLEDTIGGVLTSKAKEVLVAIHTWNHPGIGPVDNQNNVGKYWMAGLAPNEMAPDNLLWRATARTSSIYSHHQKFVVLDAPGPSGRRELVAFFGGLDLTKGRFDWKEHWLSCKEGGKYSSVFREQVGYKHLNPISESIDFRSADDWYNGEFDDNTSLPREPWHDIYAMLTGPTAWDFVTEFVGRWCRTPDMGGSIGDLDKVSVDKVWDMYRKLHEDRKTFIQQSEPRNGIFAVQTYHSIEDCQWGPPERKAKDEKELPLYRKFKWKPQAHFEMSIQLGYRRAIDQAERFIYIENQYFIGSGKHWGRTWVQNDIPERIVQKILERKEAGKLFHVYISMPMFPEGDPVSAQILELRKYEWLTMEYMIREIGADWENYLSFYFLTNWFPNPHPIDRGNRKERVRGNDRYMVYIHSKLMIIDDRMVILGSANLNERSLAGGRDTEIACGIWPGRGHAEEAVEKIRNFRKELWEEHFGAVITSVDQPESLSCSKDTRRRALTNYWNFRSMRAAPVGHICRLPLVMKQAKLTVGINRQVDLPDPYDQLPDSPKRSHDWLWASPGTIWPLGEIPE